MAIEFIGNSRQFAILHFYYATLPTNMNQRNCQSLMKAILIGCFCVHFSRIKAQTSEVDSSFYPGAVSSAISAYDSSRKGLNSGIFNGIEHLGYLYSIKGTPYFGPDGWQTANV